MSTTAPYATSLSDEQWDVLQQLYPNPSGSPVDPDVHLSTSDVWSMVFSMSIKRVVNSV